MSGSSGRAGVLELEAWVRSSWTDLTIVTATLQEMSIHMPTATDRKTMA